MLKKFFLNVLSAFTGAWLAIILSIFVVVVIGIVCLANLFGGNGMELKKHSVYIIELQGNLVESTENGLIDATSLVLGTTEESQSLRDIQLALDEAITNDDIDVVYLHCNGVTAAPATLHALRTSIADFKRESNKPVIAYGDTYTQGDYYVATAADSIYLNPMGNVALSGIGGQTPFMKDLFDKIGVEFQVAKVGKFKSAVEPFTMTEMSDPAKAQLDTLYNELWTVVRGDIAEARNLKSADIDSLINKNVPIFSDADFALKHKLVDRVVYENDVNKILAKITEKEKTSDINIVNTECILNSMESPFENADKDDQVAVLFASGDIQEELPSGINCYYLVPEINRLAEDDNVKALVMRVNSGGGSVFGSEQIWKALENFKAKGKPYIVSMGDYAASGGYYISCGADKIYADSLTITGSIGIFGLIPNIQGLTEKVGINFETVATNPNGLIEVPLKPLNEEQLAAIQKNVENGYDLFTKRVAEGRKMSQAKVKEIGEGRVWDALHAKEIGLVDAFGSLDDAIDYAAMKARLKGDYNVAYYPKIETTFFGMIEVPGYQEMRQKFMDRNMWISNVLGSETTQQLLNKVQAVLIRKPVQAKMIETTIYL